MTEPGTGNVGAGRYAPSPSGDLHIGNLRTALLAWLCARSTGRRFIMRVEDIDAGRSSAESARRQLADLTDLGIDWDELWVQSDRLAHYESALTRLTDAGLTYPCFCTRKEIAAAARAPHGPPGSYPGTCRNMTPGEVAARRRDREPAIRLRSAVGTFTIEDDGSGPYTGTVDDFVLRRADGFAYNLAVVVDDGAGGIDQVVRGDDLLESAPRQAYLAQLLGVHIPRYRHVPLVLGPSGARLAKRDGAVTWRELHELGWDRARLVRLLATSAGLDGAGTPAELLPGFDPARIGSKPYTFVPAEHR